MEQDVSSEEHRANPDGGNSLGPGGSPSDRGPRLARHENKVLGPDFIVRVKVESEFVDDYSSLIKDEAPLVKMETFQSDSLQTSQDDLSNEHVKQEPCVFPPAKPSKDDQLLEGTQLACCSNCFQLFHSELFNRHLTQTACRETDKFSSVSCNRSRKSCAETLKDIQGNKRPHKCSVFTKSFTMLSYFNRDQKMHTSEKPHKCCVCRKAFVRSTQLYFNKTIHAEEKPHPCTVCPKAFTQLASLHDPQRIHIGEKPSYKSSCCSKDFGQFSHLSQHQKIHDGDKELEILSSGRTPSHFLEPTNGDNSQRQKSHKCSVCNKDFVRSSHLHQHQKIHTGEKPHKCHVCLKDFRGLATLNNHQRTHTGEKPYKCCFCSKDFGQLSHLFQHKKIHSGQKPHKCSLCLKAFGRLETLKNHQTTHTGEKPYKCSVCPMAFRLLQSLRSHKGIHTGEKPYKCSVCPKVFRLSQSLKSHDQRMHRIEKPFKCSLCSKDFGQLSQLSQHKKIHSEEWRKMMDSRMKKRKRRSTKKRSD